MMDASLTLGIGHNYRYGAAVWEMKKIIESEKLGEIHHIEGNLSHQGQLGVQGWRRSRGEAPTGGIVHFGAHIIDIMCWYGGPMREVYAQLESRIIENDVGSVLVKFESGTTGYLANLMTTPASFHMQVMGSEGWARANGWMNTDKITTCFGAGKPEESGGHTEEIKLPYRDILTQLRANDENFTAPCMGEEDYLFTPDEMAHTAAIHEAIAKSAGSGQPTAVLIECPEIGTLGKKQVASLASLAPMTRQSGTWKGKAFIQGGRKLLRDALYMPALVASRFNPCPRNKYQAMINAGKPAKVALTTIMRKLIELANTPFRAEWKPKLA